MGESEQLAIWDCSDVVPVPVGPRVAHTDVNFTYAVQSIASRMAQGKKVWLVYINNKIKDASIN
jgi:hypothetical protein